MYPDMRPSLVAVMVLLAAVALPITSFGAEEEGRTERRTVEETDDAAADARDERWLGLIAQPATPALKAQLGLDERLVVERVVPDGPAARAGVQEYDILVRLGYREIRTLDDLLRGLRDAPSEGAIGLVVLRRGEEQELRITPAARPAGIAPPGEREQRRDVTIVRDWLGEESPNLWRGQPFRFRILGPGFVADADEIRRLELRETERAELPAGWTVQIEKSGGQRARVTVERGDERWEATEGALESLPAEIRPHIERMLGARLYGFDARPSGEWIFREPRFRIERFREWDGGRGGRPRPPAAPAEPTPPARGAQPVPPAAPPPAVGELLQRIQGPLEEMRRELESLREEVRRLREERRQEN